MLKLSMCLILFVLTNIELLMYDTTFLKMKKNNNLFWKHILETLSQLDMIFQYLKVKTASLILINWGLSVLDVLVLVIK